MKTKTYRALVTIISLLLIFITSCGREGEGLPTSDHEGTTSAVTTVATTTAASIEDPICTEEATVVGVNGTDVVLDMGDGTRRTVALEQFYVRGTRLTIEKLCIGDKVRLDCNAPDENEVYTLHLMGREVTVPEGAVSATYRVTSVSGREVTLAGDIILGTYEVFFEADGTPNVLRMGTTVREGDLLTVFYDGVLTASEPAQFGTVYKIVRVAA